METLIRGPGICYIIYSEIIEPIVQSKFYGGKGAVVVTLFPLQTVLPTTTPLQASFTVIPPPPLRRPPPIKILIVRLALYPEFKNALCENAINKDIYLCSQTTLLSSETSGFTAMILWQISRQKQLYYYYFYLSDFKSVRANFGELEPSPDYHASLGPGERLSSAMNYQDLMSVYT